MATAPRIRPTSPDSSELGIKFFTPKSPREETLGSETVKKPVQAEKPASFKNLSEREQVRMLWGSRRRKTAHKKKIAKKKRSTRRK